MAYTIETITVKLLVIIPPMFGTMYLKLYSNATCGRAGAAPMKPRDSGTLSVAN